MSNKLICAYGDGTHGKTTFLDSVIRHCLSKDRKFKARLYTCENWDVLEPWFEAGILDVIEIDIRQEPFDTIVLASQGYRPEDPEDPSSKFLPPEKQKDFEGIGAWFYEGMATFCDYMMGTYARGGLAARHGRGERVGPAEETISFTDGGSKVGGNPRTDYNISQNWIYSAVRNTKKLPGHVIWTSHEVTAKDSRSNKLILGPELVGTAATPKSIRWFGNTIHVYRVDKKITRQGKEASLQSDYRLYLKSHYTEEIPNIPYKAVMRVSPLIQEEADKLIPDFIPNTPEAFEKLMKIRDKIDTLSQGVIEEMKKKTA